VSVLAALFVGTLLTSVTPGCGGTEPPRVRNASVVRVDARSGRVEAVVPVGVDPLQLVVAARQVWTMEFGQGTLSRIDPASNKAAAIDIGQAAGMASDGEDIWVAANGNTLVRLDGESGKRERVLKLAGKPLFELRDAGFLIVSARSIWLTIPVLGDNSADQTLWRIDPQTGAVKARAPLLANPVSLAADARSVWVANIDGGKVTRVEVATNTAKNVAVSIGPAGVATGAESLWVSHYVPEVWRIGPEDDARAGEDPPRRWNDARYRLRRWPRVGVNRIGRRGARSRNERGRADDRPDRAETGGGADRHRLPRWRSVGLDRMTPSRGMTSKTNAGHERAGTTLVVPR
jgi:DNA-binding beta-propeller fold protein YncE